MLRCDWPAGRVHTVCTTDTPRESLFEGRRKGLRGEVASPTVPHGFFGPVSRGPWPRCSQHFSPPSPADAPHASCGPAWLLLKALHPQPSCWSSPQGVWSLFSILENITHNSVTHAHKHKQV